MRRLIPRLAADESGFSIVFVSLVMVAMVSMIAFAVDVAALQQERRELQNGADAAAIAIAEDCARGLTCNTPTATATADVYADANAHDGAAAVDSVTLDTTAQSVEVVVSTDTGSGSIFRPFFAQIFGYGGTTVEARATAIWGNLGSLANGSPLIISDCEWARETNNGANLYTGPIPPDASAPPPVVLKFHSGTNSADDCAAQAGQDADGDGRLSGGFGWIDTSGGCTVDSVADSWVPVDPGVSPSTGCSAAEFEALMLNQVVTFPYFNDIDGVGAGGQYHIAGYGAFYVTGYFLGGQYKAPGPPFPCNGPIRCIAGYFVPLTTTDGDPGGDDRGVTVITFSG